MMTRNSAVVHLPFMALVALGACGHAAGTAPPVPLHKGYTAFDSKPVGQTAASPERPAAAPNKLVPAPPVEAPSPPLVRAPAQRYEPPMPLTIAESPQRSAPTRPPESTRFAVHGVDRSDVLYVRSAPGVKSPVIGEIAPDTSGIIGLAGQQQIGSSTWREIKYGNVRGWVNARFLVDGPDGPDADSTSTARPRAVVPHHRN
jgi:hypothetical protein